MIFDGGNTAVASRTASLFNPTKGTVVTRRSTAETNICAVAFPVAGPLTQHATVTPTKERP